MKRPEPNTFIKPSKIHGLGLFASRDIKKGETIIQGKIDLSKSIDEWIIYNKSGQIPSFANTYGYCMINHSESPNTMRGGKMSIQALKDIKEGQEITEDYYRLPDNENPFLGFDLQKAVFQARHSTK